MLLVRENWRRWLCTKVCTCLTISILSILLMFVTGKFKTGMLDENSDAITADKLHDLLLQSDHDKVVNTEVMSDEILEALLDRKICKKPGGDVQGTPSENDKTSKNFFRVLEETDTTGRDLQGINSENTQSSTDEPDVNTSSS